MRVLSPSTSQGTAGLFRCRARPRASPPPRRRSAPCTARLSAGSTAPKLAAQPPSEIFFSYLGTEPGLRHALELRAYRADDLVQLDWWYDTRSFDSYTVEELAEQLPLALIELTSEAMPQPHTPMAVGH